jgi:hypothetical protein
MTLADHIRKSRDSQWSIRFKTRHPDEDSFDGIVIHIGHDFVAIREEVSFELDGVVILPTSVITDVRDGKYERCCNAILRQNGAIAKDVTPGRVEHCNTLRSVVDELMKRDIWPAIEIVYNRGRDSALYLGPITRTSTKRFSLRCYDAAGRWEKEYRLRYREIFKVEVGSTYCVHFNSYMRLQDGTELSHAPEPAQRSSSDPGTAVAPAR